MSVHKNSAVSYGKIDREKKIRFVMQVFNKYPNKCFTDMEVSEILRCKERNEVSPGITWALEDGLIYKNVDDRFRPESGRWVRQCSVNKDVLIRKNDLFENESTIPTT